MTLEAVAPVTPIREPWDDLIETLTECLERAQRGEVLSFAFVAEDTDGTIRQRAFHGKNSNAFKMVGVLETLKMQIIERAI